MRFLVIEDDDSVRDLITRILRDEHYDVIEAVNGIDATKFLNQDTNIDIIITDIIMPEKEGIETIMDIKRDYPHIRVLAISGGGKGSAESYLSIAKFVGADLTLNKPFIRKELLDAIQQLVD
jgi:CheY-like chemotaxis protein